MSDRCVLRAAACAALLLAVTPVAALANPVSLISKADPARPSDSAGGPSFPYSLSADGRYVAFFSLAPNLLGGVTDPNGYGDVFLHDRVTGETVLVSHAAGDPTTAADAGSDGMDISADGRWVAFQSVATNLVPGQADTNGISDVFLWDRVTDTTVLVSHEAGSATTAAGCFAGLAISADGNWVAYNSVSSNLVPGQTNPPLSANVVLYERATGTNTLVSHASGSATTGGSDSSSSNPQISADGSRVVYDSFSTDLVAGQNDASHTRDTFLYDRVTGTNALVSHTSGSATTATGKSLTAVLSADGSYVAFESEATGIAAGQADANNTYDTFLYDVAAGTSSLISHTGASATTTANGFSGPQGISTDGRWTVFVSNATNLLSGVTHPAGTRDIFLHDRTTGTNVLVTRSSSSATTPGNGESFLGRISGDGNWIALLSQASDLVSGQSDGVGSDHMFLWSRATGTTVLAEHAAGLPATASNGGGFYPALHVSEDGSWIAYASDATDLVAGLDDANATTDVFLYSRASGDSTLVTQRQGDASHSASGYLSYKTATSLSNDGRYAVFLSAAPNLIPGAIDGNNSLDVFLHDGLAGTTTLVSHVAGDPVSAAGSPDAEISRNGNTLVFLSDAPDIVAGQSTPQPGQLFAYNRKTGGAALVSGSVSSPTAGSNAAIATGQFVVSGDGRWIAFASRATDIVAGQVDTNSNSDVFLHDRATGQTRLVSRSTASATQTGNFGSRSPSLSADGRYLAFVSDADNLVPNSVNGISGIFLFDRVANTMTQVSPSGSDAVISADGSSVAFSAQGDTFLPVTQLHPGAHAYLWNRLSGATALVNHISSSTTTTGSDYAILGKFLGSRPSPLSADGRWVVFITGSTQMVAGEVDTNNRQDVYLYDRDSATVSLVSRSTAGPTTTANSGSETASISADGTRVSFFSWATDLVPGAGLGNTFVYDRPTGAVSLVSHLPEPGLARDVSAPESSVTAAAVLEPDLSFFATSAISADGSWSLFQSESQKLVPFDLNFLPDVFLHRNGSPGRDFFTLPPCRVLDTRAGTPLSSGVERKALIAGSCGVPATARALAVNVTIVQPTANGLLTLHPGDVGAPLTSTINFLAGTTRSNNAVLALALDGTGTLSLTPSMTGNGTVHVILDVSGWFQ
jgi:hypothetical protein